MPNRLLALLLSIPLASSGAAGVVLHVCQSMGGVAVGDCDCDERAEHASHGDHGAHAQHALGAKLQEPPCCTVELADASAVVATHEAYTLRIDNTAIGLVDSSGSSVPSTRLACDLGLLRERAPPNIHGPPIFVRNCAFLN